MMGPNGEALRILLGQVYEGPTFPRLAVRLREKRMSRRDMTATPIGVVAGIAAIFLLDVHGAHSQTIPAPTPAAETQAASVFKQEELDQLLAPIALYPDPLLAQILMAATYPLEIVQADRWARLPDHAQLKGNQLAAALDQ
jgi:hypothetical protein